MYSFDTSAFMDWQFRYYPLDVFAALETKIAQMIAAGQAAAVELVHEEIDAVGTPDIRQWVKHQAGLFVPMDEDVQMEGARIEAQYPDLMDPNSPYQDADAYVIALAKLRSGVVVSGETPASSKRKPKKDYFIPDVCREMGIPCINILGLMRREKWVF